MIFGRRVASGVRANLFVSDAFCADAIDAVEQIPELAAAKKLDSVQGRNHLQFLTSSRRSPGASRTACVP